ncbi:hypothetical protein BC830DRAFT_386649 [Chytriomyces sp. MP71]|nr:hypothetical protein BC830DRAFT_386649 [Chytriomyces sp. MP71]
MSTEMTPGNNQRALHPAYVLFDSSGPREAQQCGGSTVTDGGRLSSSHDTQAHLTHFFAPPQSSQSPQLSRSAVSARAPHDSPITWPQGFQNSQEVGEPSHQQHPTQHIQHNLDTASNDGNSEKTGGKTVERRARRRAAHNAVERRRRDIINEKIQELSLLLPDHHLLPADSQNKGSILRRGVDHLRGVQALAGRQADRIIELEGVCRSLLQRAGVQEHDIVMSFPLGTTFELPVPNLPGGGVTGNQLAGALMAAGQAIGTTPGSDPSIAANSNRDLGMRMSMEFGLNDANFS